MAVTVEVLVAAVGAISTFVKEAGPIVNTIRSGFMARNKEAQMQLAQKLQELQHNLQLVGELTQVVETYFETHENVLELLSHCSRAQEFLKENIEECRNKDTGNYSGNWKILDIIFQNMKRSDKAANKVILDRAKWYDQQDKDQIELLLQQYTAHYGRGEASVRHKVADDVLHELRGMTNALEDTEALLRNTIYGKILKALQSLGN